MNRTEFQQLAEVRIKEAQALLAAGLWDGAYYLAGYAVECGLKACIAKLTKAEEFPPPMKVVDQCYTHDAQALVLTAGLENDRRTDMPPGSDRKGKWEVVKKWTEASRYLRSTEAEARELFDAVTNPTDGVLTWIKARW